MNPTEARALEGVREQRRATGAAAARGPGRGPRRRAAALYGVPRLLLHPVAAILAVDLLLLVTAVSRYGYDRDELYFRVLAAHPAWGYVDQSPLTPMLAKAGIALLGDNLWALRLPALLCALAAVTLTALLARELGGGRPAQALAAAGVSGTFVLVAGHVLLTATPDLVLWLLAVLFATRALNRRQPRWWLLVGLTVGAASYNKQLVVLLLLGLAAGLLLAGPREELRSHWLWAGAAVAAIVALPNLLYQLTHGWPELTMARALAAHKGHDDRIFFLPFQVVLLGPVVTPIWVAGLLRLLREPRLRRVRSLGWAYLVVAALVLLTGGQPYYTVGLLVVPLAVGCVACAEWLAGRPARQLSLAAAMVAQMALVAVVALPVLPVTALPAAVTAVNQTAADSVGWPVYVQEVAGVYDALPPLQRARAVVVTDNYGEAGALARYGAAAGLPTVYSGQNQLFDYGPPPRTATVVILVGLPHATGQFQTCRLAGRLDNRVGVANEEQGRPITVCRDPDAPWPKLWPGFRHFD